MIEGIETLVFLDTLNISNNSVGTISGLGGCTMLTTLTMTHNRCKTADDVRGLLDCPTLRVVDLSHNKLEDPEAMEVFKAMPGLRVLNLMGNPVIRKTSQYRKTMINEIKQLSYLDDRPVFPKERVCAEAFMKGGREAEREARTKFMENEKERQARGIRHLMELQARGAYFFCVVWSACSTAQHSTAQHSTAQHSTARELFGPPNSCGEVRWM